MSMSVLQHARAVGESNYYIPSFNKVLEDHLEYISKSAISDRIIPTGRQYAKFIGDFTGLLIELDVKEEYHWITMRINGLHSSMDYLDESLVIKLINPSIIKNILMKHLATLAKF